MTPFNLHERMATGDERERCMDIMLCPWEVEAGAARLRSPKDYQLGNGTARLDDVLHGPA